MRFDPERVKANVRRADTEDLLDRATVYRAGMEPEAVVIILAELRSRGVSLDDVAAHDEKQRGRLLFREDGMPEKCWRCHRPAIDGATDWFRLLGFLPLFPRRVTWCAEHQPTRK